MALHNPVYYMCPSLIVDVFFSVSQRSALVSVEIGPIVRDMGLYVAAIDRVDDFFLFQTHISTSAISMVVRRPFYFMSFLFLIFFKFQLCSGANCRLFNERNITYSLYV